MTQCNWAGDPDCRTLIHVMLCPVCSTRWQHLAAAVEAEIPHHGPVMADGTFKEPPTQQAEKADFTLYGKDLYN